jgi:hypothetical protein
MVDGALLSCDLLHNVLGSAGHVRVKENLSASIEPQRKQHVQVVDLVGTLEQVGNLGDSFRTFMRIKRRH